MVRTAGLLVLLSMWSGEHLPISKLCACMHVEASRTRTKAFRGPARRTSQSLVKVGFRTHTSLTLGGVSCRHFLNSFGLDTVSSSEARVDSAEDSTRKHASRTSVIRCINRSAPFFPLLAYPHALEFASSKRLRVTRSVRLVNVGVLLLHATGA